MGGNVRARWRHVRAIGKSWLFVFPAIWGLFWTADAAIEKWDLGLRTWWEANTAHLPKEWQAYLIVLLVLLIVGLVEGSFRHDQGHISARNSEITALDEEVAGLKKDLEAERDRSRPRFKFSVKNFAVAPMPQSLRDIGRREGNYALTNATAISHVEVELLNSGAPSVAVDWKCDVTVGGVLCRSFMYNPGEGWTTLDTVPPTVLSGKDFMYEKTAGPIPSGGRAIGWLSVLLLGPTAEEAHAETSLWRFYFQDVTGEINSFDWHPRDGEGARGFAYQPGRH